MGLDPSVGNYLRPEEVQGAMKANWANINEREQQQLRAMIARAQMEQANAELQSKYDIAQGGWANQRSLAELQAKSHRDALQVAMERSRMGIGSQEKIAGMGQQTAVRGQDVQERLGLGQQGVTTRGQDITQQLGTQGNLTTQRGQDIGQQSAEQDRQQKGVLGMLGLDVAKRGQDMGLEGKKMGLQAAKETTLGQREWQSGEHKLDRASRESLADTTTTRQEGLMDKRQEQQNNLAYQKTLGDPMQPPLAKAHAALNATTPGAESLKNAARMFSDPKNENEFIQNLATVHDWQQKGVLQKKLTEAVDAFTKRQGRISQGLPAEEPKSGSWVPGSNYGWGNAIYDAGTVAPRAAYNTAKTMFPYFIPGM